MEIYPGFAGIVKDYDSLNNKPTIGGKAIQGELISDDYVDFTPANGSNKLVTSGGVEEELKKKADEAHFHDDRYYTEDETDILLSGKSDFSHLHRGVYLTREEIEELVSWVAAGSHHHDGRYYTEAETDSLLAGKSNASHTHDGRYYTEAEITSLLSGKSDALHLHSGVYLTREEIEELVSGVSANSHHHDGRYYTEAETDSLLAGKSNASHTHDGRYYTEAEITSLLSGKSNTDHSHSYSSLSDKPTIDGKELSGNITTDGLMYKRLLTSSDDLDDIFEDGVYVYSTSSLPKNAPFSNAAVIEVFGARSTTTQKIQRAYRYGEAGHSAFRPLYAGTWGAWSYPVIIKEATVTKTTSEVGNCSLGLNLDDYIVLSAFCTAGNKAHVSVPYRASTTREWAVRVFNSSSMEILASTEVSITFFYTKRQ